MRSLLNDQTALVTGGAKGLGQGIAIELAKAGAFVAIGDLDLDGAQKTVNEIVAFGGQAMACSLDVTESSSIENAMEQVMECRGSLDILVNNAGVQQQKVGMDTTAKDFDFCHKVNVQAIWQVTQAIVPYFKQRQQGKIVNISSGAGRRGSAFLPAYCASKAAVISLTQSLAHALGPFNINVNAICPGLIWTPMWEHNESILGDTKVTSEVNERRIFNKALKGTPLQRPQTPEDVGQAVVFLVSSMAKNITGQSLNVDGGASMN